MFQKYVVSILLAVKNVLIFVNEMLKLSFKDKKRLNLNCFAV